MSTKISNSKGIPILTKKSKCSCVYKNGRSHKRKQKGKDATTKTLLFEKGPLQYLGVRDYFYKIYIIVKIKLGGKQKILSKLWVHVQLLHYLQRTETKTSTLIVPKIF